MRNLISNARKIISRVRGRRTWHAIEYFDPSWSNRIQAMARYIPPEKSVIDLGCGQMWLKQFIEGRPYYPVDYAPRGEGTIICNFNRRQFPTQRADVAFVSGALEYVIDPVWFISCIAQNSDQCVISYCLTEDYPDIDLRRKHAWVNNYSRDQLVQVFSNAGFELADEDKSIPKNRIFNFLKSTAR